MTQQMNFNDIAHYKVKYDDKVIIIKCGGDTLKNPEQVEAIAQQATHLRMFGCRPVIVHGAGPQTKQALMDAGIEEKFDPVDGTRVTDKPTMDISEHVLQEVNSKVCKDFNAASADILFKVHFLGMSPHESQMIIGEKRSRDNFTADVIDTNVERILPLLQGASKNIPVISCTSYDVATGGAVNINADHVTAALAKALDAQRVLFLSNVQNGIEDVDRKRIPELTSQKAYELIEGGVIYGGMKTKVMTCLDLLERSGVSVAVLPPEGIQEELFTRDGSQSATLFRRDV